MRFSLPVLSAAQVLIAENPEIGVESNAFASAEEVILLGTIKTDALGVATWYPKAGADYGAGLDIHVSNDTPLNEASAPTVSLDATVVTSGAGTLLSTYAVPSYSANQGHIYPAGSAFDMIPQGVGNSARLVTAITGVDALTNIPANSELSIWGSPASSNFVEVGWGKSVDGAYNTVSTISIANRYNPTGATKKGVGEVAELSMDFNHISSMDGMCRYNGLRVTILNKIIADDTVHKSNIVYTGYRPNAKPTRGSGNDEVIETSTGPYEKCLVFNAL